MLCAHIGCAYVASLPPCVRAACALDGHNTFEHMFPVSLIFFTCAKMVLALASPVSVLKTASTLSSHCNTCFTPASSYSCHRPPSVCGLNGLPPGIRAYQSLFSPLRLTLRRGGFNIQVAPIIATHTHCRTSHGANVANAAQRLGSRRLFNGVGCHM